MGDFLSNIKRTLNEPRNRIGRYNEVAIGLQDLLKLIDSFEKLDSEARARYEQAHVSIEELLSRAIEAVYRKQDKNSETTMLIIMDTLKPLMDEKRKSPIPYIKARAQNWKF